MRGTTLRVGTGAKALRTHRRGRPARGGLLLALAALLLGGCSWVPLTAEGESVRLVDESETAGCEELGRTSARTTDRVLIFARGRGRVAEELRSLARNEAAKMGGDTIAARGPVSEGRQEFGVYRCVAR